MVVSIACRRCCSCALVIVAFMIVVDGTAVVVGGDAVW